MTESRYDLTLKLDALYEEKRRIIAGNTRPPLFSDVLADRNFRMREVERLITEVATKLTSKDPK